MANEIKGYVTQVGGEDSRFVSGAEALHEYRAAGKAGLPRMLFVDFGGELEGAAYGGGHKVHVTSRAVSAMREIDPQF